MLSWLVVTKGHTCTCMNKTIKSCRSFWNMCELLLPSGLRMLISVLLSFIFVSFVVLTWSNFSAFNKQSFQAPIPLKELDFLFQPSGFSYPHCAITVWNQNGLAGTMEFPADREIIAWAISRGWLEK